MSGLLCCFSSAKKKVVPLVVHDEHDPAILAMEVKRMQAVVGELKAAVEANAVDHTWRDTTHRDTLQRMIERKNRQISQLCIQVEHTRDALYSAMKQLSGARSQLQVTVGDSEGPVCEICVGRFEEFSGKAPMILACGHTICLGCVMALVVDREGISFVGCPYCRSDTVLTEGVEQLPKNYALLQYAERFRDETQDSSK